jgi:hypothetical protein
MPRLHTKKCRGYLPPRTLSLSLKHLNTALVKVKVQVTLRLTVSQSVSKSSCRAPSGAHDQIFITLLTVTVLFLWGALSDERRGLSFVYAAGPYQCSLSRVRVPWALWPYFIVSDLRLSFLSPSTTRRVTVEVFDPTSTRVTAFFIPRISL